MGGAEGGMGIGQLQRSGEHSQTRTNRNNGKRLAEGNSAIAATPRRCHKNIQHVLDSRATQ
jgi:hypothetical protein